MYTRSIDVIKLQFVFLHFSFIPGSSQPRTKSRGVIFPSLCNSKGTKLISAGVSEFIRRISLLLIVHCVYLRPTPFLLVPAELLCIFLILSAVYLLKDL